MRKCVENSRGGSSSSGGEAWRIAGKKGLGLPDMVLFIHWNGAP